MGGGKFLPSLSLASIMLVLFSALLVFNACKKEKVSEIISDDKMEAQGVIDRESTAQYQTRVETFKSRLDAWRSGSNLTETEDAAVLVEGMESVLNYYLGNVGKAYGWDRVYYDSVSIAGTNTVWTGSTAAQVFEQIKTKITGYYNDVNGPDKGVRMVDLGVPTAMGSETKFYFYVEIGHTPLQEEEVTEELGDMTIKWAGEYIRPVLPCEGAADTRIGRGANINIGIYFQNLAPNATSPTDPCVIVERVVNCVTNEDGTPSPAGGTIIAVPYTIFPTGAPAGPNGTYPFRGQYRIHYDPLGNQGCFEIDKVSNYVVDNLWVGRTYFTPIVKGRPGLANHQLIGTAVLSQWVTTDLGSVAGGLRTSRHGHPTAHYYAIVRLICRPPLTLPNQI